MIYLLAILLSAAAGFFVIRLLCLERGINFLLQLFLGLALGLGIDGTLAFYTHILFNQFNRWIPLVLEILLVIYLAVKSDAALFPVSKTRQKPKTAKKSKAKASQPASALSVAALTKNDAIGLAVLAVLAVPLFISAHYYPLGGWDAWSCWSLKAKFIFLGHDNWKDVLAPGLWRSNTHYPLLWPLINVWFFDAAGRFDQLSIALNSVTIALLTAGVVLYGIWELTGQLLPSLIAAILTVALPFGVTLYISQYSDALVGLYFLSAFTCLLLAEKKEAPGLKIAAMVFLGLMTFAKNEGLVAGVIAAALIIINHRKEAPKLILFFVLAALPTIIFTLFIAPKNEAFVNGLVSHDKPTTLSRLTVIAVYPLIECISGKWNGFWVLALGGIILAGKKLWQSTSGIIALSVICYMGVVMAYYAVNTFFEINWWLSTTLSRIIFALVPTVVLWITQGLARPSTQQMHARKTVA